MYNRKVQDKRASFTADNRKTEVTNLNVKRQVANAVEESLTPSELRSPSRLTKTPIQKPKTIKGGGSGVN